MRVHSRCSEASPCYGLGSCRAAIRTGNAHLERGYRRSQVLRSGATCRSAPSLPGRSAASDLWRCQAYIEGRTAEAEVAVGRKVVESSFPAVEPGYAEAIMLQGFGWDSCAKGNWYGRLEEKISDMKKPRRKHAKGHQNEAMWMQEMGVTHLWLPPPSQSVSKQGYMPGQLYNLSSFYGNKEELQRLNRKLRSEGISPLADVVINHRCADEQGDDGRWNVYTDDVDHHGNRIDWGIWAITGDDPEYGGQGNADTGADYGPAPDLDHANPALRDALVDWMNYLHEEVGYVGWRFDFAKGYAAWCTKEYVERTVGSDVLNVGELWADLGWEGSSLRYEQNGARQYIVDWIDNNGRTATAFDFPLKGILQEAVKNCEYNRLNDGNGKGPGVAGWWPSMAVTFVDNHDTGSTQRHWPFPDSGLETGYAYIITHPGIPCIFWDHFNGGHLSEVIKNLIAIRKKCAIINASKLKIRCADHDMYVAQVDDSLVLKLGPRYDMGQHLPKESDGWKLDLYGKDFAIWTRT